MRKIFKILLMLMGCIVVLSFGVWAANTVSDFNGKCSRGFAVIAASYKGEDETKPKFESYCLVAHLVYKCNRGECSKSLKNHTVGDVFGIVVSKYNEPEKIVWATNFKWVVQVEGFYEFFKGSQVEPWGPICGYEKIFVAFEKLFLETKEAVETFPRKDQK